METISELNILVSNWHGWNQDSYFEKWIKERAKAESQAAILKLFNIPEPKGET